MRPPGAFAPRKWPSQRRKSPVFVASAAGALLLVGLGTFRPAAVAVFFQQRFKGSHRALGSCLLELREHRGVTRQAARMDFLEDFGNMANEMQAFKEKRAAQVRQAAETAHKQATPSPSASKAPAAAPAPDAPSSRPGAAAVFEGGRVYTPGEDVTGEVIKVSEHGVTVQLEPEVLGFVHVSEIANGYVYHPQDEVKLGQTVTARVRRVEREFVQLSIKQVTNKKVTEFKIQDAVEGKVKVVLKFGLIVDLGAEVDALLHKSQLTEKVPDPKQVFKVGDQVKAYIMYIDVKKKKFGLTQQKIVPVAGQTKVIPMSALKEGQWLPGVVTSVQKKGIHVNIGAEQLGFVSLAKINYGVVGNIHDLIKRGDEVTAKVHKLKNKCGFLELRLRQPLPRVPKVDDFCTISRNKWLNGIVVNIGLEGAIILVENPIAKGSSVAALMRERWMRQGQEIGLGDQLQVRVLNADVEKRMLTVTSKDPPRNNV